MEEKTFIVGSDTASANSIVSALAPMLQQRGLDPNLLLSMNNGGFGNNSFIWVLFILLLWNRNGWGNDGWGGNGNHGCIASQLNDVSSRELLMQAIQGNASAINSLANNFNCSAGQIQSAINAVSTQIQNVGSTLGMSTQQVINAVQSGNCAIANQLSQCCCTINNAITTQGYENRLANLEQTNNLGGRIDATNANLASKIDNQTNVINDKFCQLEMREQMHTIDAQREEITTLKNQISNMQQTQIFGQMIGQATAPITAAVNSLQNDINGIKCKLPETVTVPNSPGVLVPNCVAYNMGIYGVTPFNNAGGFWG